MPAVSARRFEDFSRSILLADEEKNTLLFWKESDVFRRSLELRKGAPRFVFYEGPPTANGRPGIHHVLGRTIKDLACRYQAMKGKLVERKSGWDTHGLPVELEVEKKLGIQGKEQIEAFGLEKFNALCKESVFTYKDEWERMTDRIAFWLDLEHPYVTLENDYIETVWWLLRQFWDKGLVYEGFKILPYCPRCETPLSSHEVSQGYQDVEDPSVFVKFRRVDEEGAAAGAPGNAGAAAPANTYFLAWTTTPWTLISNVALAVHPRETYVRARLKPRLNKDGTAKVDAGHNPGDILILAKARLEALYGPYEILDEFPGSALHEQRYEPLFPYFRDEPNAFRVLTADYVSMSDGTGIVHSAPAFGEDDYRLGQTYGLPVARPVNRRGEFSEEITEYAGVFVKKADPAISENLKQRGLLYRSETMTHSYPFCWRCDSPLIYYARDSWYLKTTAFRDRMVEANKSVKWFPPEAGEKRFGDWLRNNIDWAISRDRYWGTPLPVWRCTECGTTDLVESRAALKARGADVPDDLDLHRPWVDRISFPCTACGKPAFRVPEVIDVWFDSGAMPFAQWHYPFENRDTFEAMFPADFISEGIDQSRGWFYSLLAISVAVKDQSPYRSVVVNDLVLDDKGQKMSKHKGNTVNPWELLDSVGADAVRWYLMVNSPPWLPTRFSKDGVTEVARKFLGTLRNVASFFAVYANVDGWIPGQAPGVPVEKRPLIDQWLLSRLDGLIETVDGHLAGYDLTRGARAIQDFVLDELSNWYVRRNRRRFWKGETGPDKEAAYATLFETIRTLAGLVAPYAPFVAEEIHQKIVRPAGGGVPWARGPSPGAGAASAPDSVHFTDFPRPSGRPRALDLEKSMQAAIDIVEAGRAARNGAVLKTRQPLARLLVSRGVPEAAAAVLELGDVIADELNVKEIELAGPERLFRIEAKPLFKTMGPAFGKDVNRVAEVIRGLSPELAGRLAAGEAVPATLDGKNITIEPAHVEIVRHPAGGLALSEQGGLVVALETALTPELVQEGVVRELVHRLQNLRKEQGLAVTDRIHVEYCASPGLEKAIRTHESMIMSETLARSLLMVAGNSETMTGWDLDGEAFQVTIRPAT